MQQPPIADQVLQWSSELTGEQSFTLSCYYWTEPVKKALFRLTRYTAYLGGIIGLIGTGKTSAMYALRDKIEQQALLDKIEQRMKNGEIKTFEKYVYCITWRVDKFWDVVDVCKNDYWKEEYRRKLLDEYERLLKTKKEKPDLSMIHIDEMEEVLPEKKINAIREQIAIGFLGRKAYAILIDFPDYSRKGSWMINRDLTDFYKFWVKLIEYKANPTNVIVCLQKELVMAHPHFFLGKIDKIMLKPLTSSQLLEAYKQIFDTYEPFSEDALRYIAELSRGVFRRFKKYIKFCVEPYVINARTDLIKLDEIDNYVTPEVLEEDLDLEMSEIFKSKQKTTQAFAIMNLVRKKQPINQKEIAEILGIHPGLLSGIIRNLEMHRYLKTKPGKGSEVLVELI